MQNRLHKYLQCTLSRFVSEPTIRLTRSALGYSMATLLLISSGGGDASGSESAALMAYVGTFSSPLKNMLPTQVDLPPGNGRGIHLFSVARSTGAMTPHSVIEMETSPSFLVFNKDRTRLYSTNETARDDRGAGTVTSFRVDPLTGGLQTLNTVSSGGAGPTYASIHPSGRYLFVANYFGGSIAVLPVLPDGSLGEATDLKQDEGPIGPRTAKNAPAGSFAFSGHDRTHAHMIRPDPAGRYVLHVDLGMDRIFVWLFDEMSGRLTQHVTHSVAFPPGDGPRHFVFHPNGRWLYSVQEEGSNIVHFEYDPHHGTLLPKQTLSTLPAHFAGSNFCSGIEVSADGRFVYVGNRLHDSVGIFEIHKDGSLKHMGEEWTRGNYPRSFAFDPSGGFLFCCNQRADNVTSFRVDRDNGKLQFTGHYTPVGNPSVIVFREIGSP